MTKEEKEISGLFYSCWEEFGKAKALIDEADSLANDPDDDREYETDIGALLSDIQNDFCALDQKMRNASVLLADAFK
jgi:hypothetical protein